MKRILKYVMLIPILGLAIFFGCSDQKEDNGIIVKANTPVAAVVQPKAEKPAIKAALIGNWTRTDGGYRLEISQLFDDGKMKARYFNPKSIHVGEAEWTSDNGVPRVSVVLKDLNYPGSTYDLAYMQQQDILAGDYFQAVEGATYYVEFVREK